MNENQIKAVSNVLAQWKPLGEKANSISELDNYRVEATDIIFALEMQRKSIKPEFIVMEVINQAFNLDLTMQSCVAPAQEIVAILKSTPPVKSSWAIFRVHTLEE
ncbi:MAG: hypothetical protein R6W75_02075 [Smithellaceae bacterium]